MARSVSHRWAIVWVLVLGLVVIPAAGVGSTRLLVSNGLARFAGPPRIAAQHALLWAELGCSEPLDRLWRLKHQVTTVQLNPGTCAVGAVPAYRAEVKTYTFFAIPAGKVSVNCGAATCHG